MALCEAVQEAKHMPSLPVLCVPLDRCILTLQFLMQIRNKELTRFIFVLVYSFPANLIRIYMKIIFCVLFRKAVLTSAELKTQKTHPVLVLKTAGFSIQ